MADLESKFSTPFLCSRGRIGSLKKKTRTSWKYKMGKWSDYHLHLNTTDFAWHFCNETPFLKNQLCITDNNLFFLHIYVFSKTQVSSSIYLLKYVWPLAYFLSIKVSASGKTSLSSFMYGGKQWKKHKSLGRVPKTPCYNSNNFILCLSLCLSYHWLDMPYKHM